MIHSEFKKTSWILHATIWSTHCSPEPVCSKISARCWVTGRAQHRELNPCNPGCSGASCSQAGQEVIFLLSSALEDQWKTFLVQQKGTKISVKQAPKDWVCWHSFRWQVGRIQLCVVQQCSSNFCYWAALYRKLRDINFLSQGLHLKDKMTRHSGKVQKHSGKNAERIRATTVKRDFLQAGAMQCD